MYASLQLNYENAKKGRDQRKLVSNVKYQSSLYFAPKQRVAEEQNWPSFKGWCHLPGLSDVESGMGQLKLGLKLVTKVTKSSCPISIHGRSLLGFY